MGTSIQIIGYLDKRKLQSHIIGWAENEYVIIEHPMVMGDLAMLPKDAAVVCRGTLDGRTYAFKSHVSHVMTQPFNYLFLTYPNAIQDMSAKDGPQVAVELPAKMVISEKDIAEPPSGGRSLSGSVTTLTHTTCTVELPSPIEISETNRFFLSFDLPNETSVETLKCWLPTDLPKNKHSKLNLQFDETDPKASPLLDFLLLASKILSQSV